MRTDGLTGRARLSRVFLQVQVAKVPKKPCLYRKYGRQANSRMEKLPTDSTATGTVIHRPEKTTVEGEND
jgi:hypothetical protein